MRLRLGRSDECSPRHRHGRVGRRTSWRKPFQICTVRQGEGGGHPNMQRWCTKNGSILGDGVEWGSQIVLDACVNRLTPSKRLNGISFSIILLMKGRGKGDGGTRLTSRHLGTGEGEWLAHTCWSQIGRGRGVWRRHRLPGPQGCLSCVGEQNEPSINLDVCQHTPKHGLWAHRKPVAD